MVDDPALNAGTQLQQLLKARGVQVGAVTRGNAPNDAAAVASVKSPPLKDIVTSMLRSSDNLTAELLVKELGVHASKQGTTAAGTAAVLAKLKELGVPVDQVVLDDGSGLSRREPRHLRDARGGPRPPRPPRARAAADRACRCPGSRARSSTSSSARRSTARSRPRPGRSTASAGSRASSRSTGPVTFAFLDNGNFAEAAGAPLRVKLGTIVGTFPDAPAADALVACAARGRVGRDDRRRRARLHRRRRTERG